MQKWICNTRFLASMHAFEVWAIKEVNSVGRVQLAQFSELVCTPCPPRADIPADSDARNELQNKVPGIFLCFQ